MIEGGGNGTAANDNEAAEARVDAAVTVLARLLGTADCPRAVRRALRRQRQSAGPGIRRPKGTMT